MINDRPKKSIKSLQDSQLDILSNNYFKLIQAFYQF